jgi:hypothetical protein
MNQEQTNTSGGKNETSIHSKNELVGWIIDRMYHLEWQVDIIITEYFNPEKKEEFEKVVLNSTILPMGAKMKILRNIDGIEGRMVDKISTLSSIRNAFAHLPYIQNIDITVDEKLNPLNVEEDNELEVMNSSGKLIKKKVTTLFKEFNVLLAEVRPYLRTLERKD